MTQVNFAVQVGIAMRVSLVILVTIAIRVRFLTHPQPAPLSGRLRLSRSPTRGLSCWGLTARVRLQVPPRCGCWMSAAAPARPFREPLKILEELPLVWTYSLILAWA